jgi:hypothetical protein
MYKNLGKNIKEKKPVLAGTGSNPFCRLSRQISLHRPFLLSTDFALGTTTWIRLSQNLANRFPNMKAGGCGVVEGRCPLQEDHKAVPDVQDHPLVSFESSHTGQEEMNRQESYHPPQHPQADEKDPECSPLLDSQAVEGEGACLVC